MWNPFKWLWLLLHGVDTSVRSEASCESHILLPLPESDDVPTSPPQLDWEPALTEPLIVSDEEFANLGNLPIQADSLL